MEAGSFFGLILTPRGPSVVMIGYSDIAFSWISSFGSAGLVSVVPTHWMPLPDAPNSIQDTAFRNLGH
jgi:hypothetical protein